MRRHAAAVLLVPALVLTACNRDQHRSSYSGETTPAQRRAAMDSGPGHDMYDNSHRDTMNGRAGAMAGITPDRRILSILNAKDQEEVEIGRLAQSRGSANEARDFGTMLVKDHSEHQQKVKTIADDGGITLIDPKEVGEMTAAEKGGQTPADPAEKLRGLSGQEFDQVFAAKMVKGHRELIQMLESARSQQHDPRVTTLIDETLPTLRHHEQTAQNLADQVGAPGRTDMGITDRYSRSMSDTTKRDYYNNPGPENSNTRHPEHYYSPPRHDYYNTPAPENPRR